MKPLKILRDGWETLRQVEGRLTQPLTPSMSVRHLKALWNQFAPILERTDELYREGRAAYLAALQLRLRRLTRKTDK